MSLSAEMQKTEMAGFVELFKIDSGDSLALYTSGRDPVKFPGSTYRPAPIKRGAFTQDATMGKTEVTVSAPPVDELTRYLPNYPIQPTWITISRLVHGEDEAINLFRGRVVSVSIADNVATAVCRSGSPILSAEVPRLVYSAMCQNDLFDSACGLSSTDYLTSTQVTVQDGTLTAPTFATRPNGYFTGGHVVHGSDMRLIVRHEGQVLHLQVPFDLSVGDGARVQVYPGCDKTAATCKNKFNNIRPGSAKGFLGMPYIPTSNPVLWGFE